MLCYGCGYNLRTLAVDGACPECGLAVGESLGPAVIHPADAAGVRRWRGGVRMLAASAGLTAVIPVWVFIGMIVGPRFTPGTGLGLSVYVFPLLVMAEHVLWAVGVHRATGRSREVDDRMRQAATRARGFAVATLFAMTVFMLLLWGGWSGRSEVTAVMAMGVPPAVFLLRMASVLTLGRYQAAVLTGFGGKRATRGLGSWVNAIAFGLGGYTLGYGLTWLGVAFDDRGLSGAAVVAGLVLFIGSGLTLWGLAWVMARKLWRLGGIDVS